jgi:hypothetical protein
VSRRTLVVVAVFVAATIGTVVLARVVRDEGPKGHALGEPVGVGYNQATRSGQRGPTSKLVVTPTAVRKGTLQDLTSAGFRVDEEDRDATPYYVDARYENLGPSPLRRTLDVSLEDSHGDLIGSTLIFNFGNRPFPECNRVTTGTVAPGDAYASCTLFLVPKGTKVGKVSFLSDNGPDDEPEFVYWESS